MLPTIPRHTVVASCYETLRPEAPFIHAFEYFTVLFLPLFCIIIRGGRNAPRLFSSIMHPLERNLGWANDSLHRTGWATGMDTESNTIHKGIWIKERPHFFFFNNFINDCRDASCLVLTCRVLYNSSYSLASVTTETALGYTWGFSILPDFHSHSHAFTDRSCSHFCIALLFNRTCRNKRWRESISQTS